ncbi:AcrR family transcriptional regulator [Metabacillus sp. SLBN-84]
MFFIIQLCYNKNMPKIIDHDKRKQQIAEATWKVIAEEGIEQATVRKIAKATGLSAGALRHYFSTQSELLLYSMNLVSERVKERTMSKTYQGDPIDLVKEALSELLPIDDERRLEMEVWLVFSVKTLVDEKLRALSEDVYVEMKEGISAIIQLLVNLGLLKEDCNPDEEAVRLHVLVDGLAIHHLLHPASFPQQKMMDALQYHLKSICTF